MRRRLAFHGGGGQTARPARSIACLAFVALLAVAFWAGAVWIADVFMKLNGHPF